MKKIIVILGRGESLKKLADFNKKVDTIILINAFWKHKNFEKSYFDDEIIHNFIKDKKINLICTSSQKFTNINTLLDKCGGRAGKYILP